MNLQNYKKNMILAIIKSKKIFIKKLQIINYFVSLQII